MDLRIREEENYERKTQFLALCMVITLLPMTALAAPTDYNYDPVNKVLTITSNDGAKSDSGWRTDHINDVCSIIVGDGVTKIDTNAIYKIPELTRVHIGKDVSELFTENNILIDLNRYYALVQTTSPYTV